MPTFSINFVDQIVASATAMIAVLSPFAVLIIGILLAMAVVSMVIDMIKG